MIDPKGQMAKLIASNYALRSSDADQGTFNDAWRVMEQFAPHNDDTKQLEDTLGKDEVHAAFDRVAATVRNDTRHSELGHHFVARRPTRGRYVIFSDHHAMFSGHRQDFFGARNATLYASMLSRYYDAGYTLVENGDVEDLVIFDPTPDEMKLRAGMTALEQLVARRRTQRPLQLARIVADPHYQLVLAQSGRFAAEDRLIRLAGNHDYDLQDSHLWGALSAGFQNNHRPGDPPYDYLLLESLDRDHHPVPRPTSPSGGHVAPSRTPASQVDYVIMHGHQFDRATNPVLAPRIGETVSECLGAFYQGPDRTWAWADQNERWFRGSQGFPNYLVSGKPSSAGNLGGAMWLAIGRLVAASTDMAVSRDELRRILGAFDDISLQGLAEAVVGYNVGWEYFESRSVLGAIVDEVLGADREFFKYRHMDELELRAGWDRVFPDEDSRPTLVLGHTHEVRQLASPVESAAAADQTYRWYLNSGAAGRFENLVWGIEIVDGVATVVGWSMVASGANQRPSAHRVIFHSQAGTVRDQARRVLQVHQPLTMTDAPPA